MKSDFELDPVFIEATRLNESGNYQSALKTFLKSAEGGNPAAMCSIAKSYIYGRGVSKDFASALNWYTKAANLGYGEGLRGLGIMYEFGEGVTVDHGKAKKMFESAFEKGNGTAARDLARKYYNGHGVAKDYDKAYHWYTRGAELEDGDSMYGLYLLFRDGEGTPVIEGSRVNKKLSDEWLYKASSAGSISALKELASKHKDVSPKSRTAELYLKAALKLDSDAMLYLARTYGSAGASIFSMTEKERSDKIAYWKGRSAELGNKRALSEMEAEARQKAATEKHSETDVKARQKAATEKNIAEKRAGEKNQKLINWIKFLALAIAGLYAISKILGLY